MPAMLRSFRAVLILCVLVVVTPNVVSMGSVGWAHNRGSLVFRKTAMLSAQPDSQFAIVLAQHPRGVIWQGLWFLKQGNPQAAASWLTASPTSDPFYLLVLAEAYVQNGNVQQAVAVLREKGDRQSLMRAGHRAWQAKRLDEAVLYFQAAWEMDPSLATEALARVLYARKEIAKAESLLRGMLADYPYHSSSQAWRHALGNILAQENHWPQVEAIYQEAVKVDPNDGLAHIGLGEALYFNGVGLDAAVGEIQYGIRLSPGMAEGYTSLGNIYRAEKRYDDADVWYQQACEREPNNVWIAAHRIDNLIESNRLSIALEVVDQTIQRFPTEPHPYYQLGQVYQRLGDLDSAIPAARKSVDLDQSDSLQYRTSLAALYESAGRIPEAIQAYRDVLVLNDGSASVYVALGRVLNIAGRWGEAISAYKRAIELEPQDATVYLEVGRLYQREERYDEAETWYWQAAERFPSNPWPWVMRGENALLADKVPLAVQILERTTTRFPDFAHGYMSLAQAYRRVGDAASALAAIEKSVALAPHEDVWYWVTAGQIYEWVGRQETALAAYRTALTVDDANQQARESIVRLQGSP